MPLTKAGRKVKRAMTQPKSNGGYGKKKGTSVFYAMINSGKLRGMHKARKK